MKELGSHYSSLDVVLDLSFSGEPAQRRWESLLNMSRNNRGELDIDLSKLDIFQSSWSIDAIIIEGKLRVNQSR